MTEEPCLANSVRHKQAQENAAGLLLPPVQEFILQPVHNYLLAAISSFAHEAHCQLRGCKSAVSNAGNMQPVLEDQHSDSMLAA